MSAGGERSSLADRLRLIVITDAALAAPRTVERVVEMALAAGAPAVQLRDKQASAGELLERSRVLRRLTSAAGALLFVNDRLDVALAVEADGVHLGPDDLPVAAARRAAPALWVGYSTDDPDDARRAIRDGADYIGCGAVYATANKPGAGSAIGLGGLERVVRAVRAPVVAIGGITAERALAVARTGAAGVAVIGAVMAAARPDEATKALLAAFSPRV